MILIILKVIIYDNEVYSNVVIDALGKPQTGITEGKTHWPGSWEFCQSQAVHYTYYNATYYTPGLPVEQREFLGKYCRVKFSLVKVLIII